MCRGMCSICAKYHIRKWQSMLLNNNWASHTQLFQMTRQNVNSLAKNVIHTIHSLNSCNERNSANNLHTWSSTLGWFFFFFSVVGVVCFDLVWGFCFALCWFGSFFLLFHLFLLLFLRNITLQLAVAACFRVPVENHPN